MGISNTIPPSRLIQPGVVANTAARPTSPFTGQAIYQTDTDEVLYYNGTSWSRPANMPWGVVASGSSATGVTLSSNTTTSIMQVTGTFYPNRRYRFHGVAYFQPTSANANCWLHVRDSAVNLIYGSLAYSSSVSQYLYFGATGFSHATASELGVTSGTGTSKTWALCVKTNATASSAGTDPDGTTGTNGKIQFLIEDVGPA